MVSESSVWPLARVILTWQHRTDNKTTAIIRWRRNHRCIDPCIADMYFRHMLFVYTEISVWLHPCCPRAGSCPCSVLVFSMSLKTPCPQDPPFQSPCIHESRSKSGEIEGSGNFISVRDDISIGHQEVSAFLDPPNNTAHAPPELSGPETGKRKSVTRKADGKLTLFVEFRGSWHEKLTLVVTHFQLNHFSLPLSGPLKSRAATPRSTTWQRACSSRRGTR